MSQAGFGTQGGRAPVAWQSHWTSNSLISGPGTPQRIALVRKNPDGSWSATEWRWTPSTRMATRAWQQSRWKLLAETVHALRPASAPNSDAADVRALMRAWELNLKGRPAEVAPGAWRWEGNGSCMMVGTVGLSISQLAMPYEETDVRHEQRAAMQLFLARRYPKADWITPFSLLPQETPGGAKYVALWVADRQMHGQLWIPRKDKSILRLRISAALAPSSTDAARAAGVFSTARAINNELGGIAAAWAVIHER